MTTISKKDRSISTYDMTCIAIFVVLMTICSWISVPAVVVFTMQTFAQFLTMGMLGGKRSTMVVFVYILLGAVGIPVFAGFQGGLGVLFGSTGGYIAGFLLGPALLWVLESVLGERKWIRPAAMFLAMALNYVFGTIWFMIVYTNQNGSVALGVVLGWCVFPFIIPDLLKLIMALALSKKLKKHVGRQLQG